MALENGAKLRWGVGSWGRENGRTGPVRSPAAVRVPGSGGFLVLCSYPSKNGPRPAVGSPFFPTVGRGFLRVCSATASPPARAALARSVRQRSEAQRSGFRCGVDVAVARAGGCAGGVSELPLFCRYKSAPRGGWRCFHWPASVFFVGKVEGVEGAGGGRMRGVVRVGVALGLDGGCGAGGSCGPPPPTGGAGGGIPPAGPMLFFPGPAGFPPGPHAPSFTVWAGRLPPTGGVGGGVRRISFVM